VARLILVEDVAGPSVLGRGGIATYVLQWAHGLRRLGHEVLLLEVLDEPPPPGAARAFAELMARCWAGGKAAMIQAPDRERSDVGELAGASAERIRQFAREADAAITLAAHYRRDPWPLIADVRPRILVDQDPGYTHLWASEGDPLDVFGEHDIHFTVGANVGTERSRLPTAGIDWQPIHNPVVLDWWSTGRPIERDRFTTVASWRDYGYLEFEGRMLGPKVEEFQSLLDLPRRTGEQLELVVDLHEQDPDRLRLIEHGWRLEDPSVVATPERYRRYIEGSLAEFSAAKGGYVGTRSGWFSDRSACYLAAGRPVVLQSTGFEDVLPTGEGLLAFDTCEQAAESLRRVRADYARHSKAARAIAREHLDSQRVLPRLLAAAGLS
jgi:hypothetical protein